MKNGINRPFKGKIAGVIGYEWHGILSMRSVLKKRISQPTLKELINRHKMRTIQQFLKFVIDFIRLGFAEDVTLTVSIENGVLKFKWQLADKKKSRHWMMFFLRICSTVTSIGRGLL